VAIDAGVDYLDLQLSEHKLRVLRAHDNEVREKGLCFVTEAGYHPGLPSALVGYAAARMDRIDSAVVGCYLNMHGDLPYTEAVDELTELFRNYPSEVFKAGRWTKPGSYTLLKIDFGPPVGQRSCYSWCLEEMRGLPVLHPSLQETGLYIASTGWLLDVVTMLLFMGFKVLPRSSHRTMGRALWWAMTSVSPPPYGVVLQVEAKGEVRGQRSRLLLRLFHADGYEFTAVPVAALLMQYNEVRRPGVHYMGHLCDPGRLVADMQTMGIAKSESQEPCSDSSRGGVP
jgi:saccharopine dehydrogenase-like NADP-dependent oxidoreductase